jgi:hypothetical protein
LGAKPEVPLITSAFNVKAVGILQSIAISTPGAGIFLMITVILYAAVTAYFSAATLHKSNAFTMGAAGIFVIGVHGAADGIRVKALAFCPAFINGKGPGPHPIFAPLFNPDTKSFFGI